MPDDKTTIKELIDTVARFENERDWRQFHSPKNLSMGLAIETAELMEHFLWLSPEQAAQVTHDPDQIRAIRHELADVFSYLLNLALVLDVDLSDAFHEKLAHTARKYPADKFRGKYKL